MNNYLWQYYLLIIVVLIQGLFCLKNNNKTFLFITFLELFFISGFRNWHVGNDTSSYVNNFIAAFSCFDLSNLYMEKGYIIFNKILSLFTHNPQAILIVTSFFILSAIIGFIHKYSKFVFLSTLLFVILQFSTTLNIVRQYIAIIIVLLSFNFVLKRQFIQFLLCCLLATTFHTSAIVSIVWYFIYPLNIKIKNIVNILIITIIIYIFFAPLLDKIIQTLGRYQSYMGNILLGEEIKVASIIKTLINFIVFIFCFISYFFIYTNRRCNTKFVLRSQFLLLSSLLALCIQFVSIRGTVLERVAFYFSFFNIISIPAFINCYSKGIKILLIFIIFGLFIFYSSIIFIYRPEWNHVLPFEFCF